MNHAGSIHAAAPAPVGLGVLEGELNFNANALSLLSNAVNSLEEKMRSVLRPTQTVGAVGKESSAQLASIPVTPSPMVKQVQEQRSQIDALIAQVNWLHERLEA